MASWILIFSAAVSAEPGFHEYQRRISELLKQESQAKDDAGRAAAVRQLCQTHREIVQDSRYANSDVLKEYRGRVWNRLAKVKAELRREMGRNASNKEVLSALATLESAGGLEVAAAESLATSLAYMGQSQGGAGAIVAFGGAAGPPDWGPDLVDLIERTINPAFWDVAGGPGTIVYFRPLHCLVVTATAEVHGRVGELVGDLRGGK